jgi:uncharacterized protein (DUF427 family)
MVMTYPTPDPVGPGQESVWSYPRPPRVVPSARLVVVRFGGALICETRSAMRLLETSHPPTWYLPRADFTPGALQPASGSSFCEWKGSASYLDVVGGGGRTARAQAWTYLKPTPDFAMLTDHVALYAAAMDGCFVDGERVTPQPGGFYGGWITRDVVGPFKGIPGSSGW